MSAKVICFDGPDGVGKSTQLAMAKADLEKQGFKVHVARTPGGTPIGEELRAAILANLERPPETDLHVYWAINIALGHDINSLRDKFDYILIDRGPLAFLAYQVYGSNLSKDFGIQAVEAIIDLWKPDMLLLFMAPLEITYERLHRGTKKLDYFESKGKDFHDRVLEGYNEAVKLFDVTIIDSKPYPATIHNAVMKVITS